MAVQRENGQFLFFISMPLPVLHPFVFCFKFIAYVTAADRVSPAVREGRGALHAYCVFCLR